MKVLIWVVYMFLVIGTFAQTKVAVPPAKISFTELAKASPKQLKKSRKLDRIKARKVRSIKKQLQAHSSLDKTQLEGYTSLIQGLDSDELIAFEQRLQEVIPELDKNKLPNYQKAKEVQKEWSRLQTVKKTYQDSIQRLTKSAKSIHLDSIDGNNIKERTWDHLPSTPVDSINDLSAEWATNKLDTAFYDFSDIKKPPLDSSLLQLSEPVLEQFLADFLSERMEAARIPLPDANQPLNTSIQQYIPELEKFDYQRPQIPDEKLIDALVQKEKDKKKEELKQIITQKLPNQEVKERKWTDGFIVGGAMEYKPQQQLIEITPSLAYGFHQKWSVGAGYGSSIALDKTSENQQTLFRSFLDYRFYRSFLFHVESEWKKQKKIESEPIQERSTYLGLGRVFTYKKVSSQVLALYNLSAPNRIDQQKFSFRIGINFKP